MAIDIFGKNDANQVELLDRLFREAVSHPVRTSWFEHSNYAYKFYEGDHWTKDEKAVLKERNQPDIVYNEIEPIVERIVGQYKRQQMTIAFSGRNAPVDTDLSESLSDVLRFIDQDNEYPFEETDVVVDGLVSGVGVMECGVETGPLGKPRIFTQYEDPYAIFPDPYCRRFDWNSPRGGARYVFRSKWMALEDAQATWPKKTGALNNAVEMAPSAFHFLTQLDPTVATDYYSRYFDKERRLIRPVECWFKQRVKKKVVRTPFGILFNYDEPTRKRVLKYVDGAYEDTEMMDQMYTAVYAGHVMIESAKESPYRTNRYPFIPFYAHRKKSGEPVGHIWRLIDPNREVNSRRSRALYMLNNRQTVFEKGAIADKVEHAKQVAAADGQIELEQGYFNKFEFRENQDIGQANLQMLQEAKGEIGRLSGEDYLQPSNEIRSGRGVAQSQLPYHLSQVQLFDNIRRFRRVRALTIVDLIKQYHDEEMVFQITDDPNKARTVTINATTLDNIRERTFDIILKDTTEYATLQDEQYNELLTTLPQIAQYGPGWGKVLVSMTNIRDKDKIVKMLEGMEQKPPAEPSLSVSIKWEEATAEEKAAIAQKMGMPELAQYELQQGRRPARDDAHETDLAKTVMREGTRAGMAAGQLELKAAGEQLKGALKNKEVDIKAQEALTAAQRAAQPTTGEETPSE